MLRKPLQLICCILFSIIIQTACTKPTDTLVTPMPTLVQPLVQVTQDKITGMVNIGERSLYINCEGEGIPTIVLVYGRDSSIDVWNLNTFYNDLKKITRTCEYDRANVGKSDPGPTPITTQDSANDLHSLLINAHVPGPYILVAHSLGGWIVRLYAGQYPEEVDGMVLLDGLHPDVGLRISAALPTETPNELAYLTSERNTWTYFYTRGTSDPERFDFLTSAEQVRAVTSLGDIPLLVLTADTWGGGDVEIDKLEYKAWLSMQRELATLSTSGSQKVIQGTSHFMWYDKPDEVINEIREFVRELQTITP